MVFEEEKIEGEGPEEFKGWKTGYRAWKLGFKGEDPRLVSMGGVTWEPGGEGEDVSDFEEGSKPFETSMHGLYSLKSLKAVKEHGYAGHGAIMGAIKPYGTVVHGVGAQGVEVFRSTKARVDSLFRQSAPCYVCSKAGRVVVRETDREHVVLCDACRKRLQRLIGKLGPETVREYTLEDLLNRLAIVYEASVVDFPEEEKEEELE